MNMRKFELFKLVLVSLLVMMLVSACGSKKEEPSTTNSGDSELPLVELTYYFPQGEMQTDYKSVEQAINEYIKPKINATIKLAPVVFGDYDQKLNTVVAAQEPFDLVWTSNWSFVYEQNSQKGAFKDLEELLDKYGSNYKNSLPQAFIDGARNSQGKLYALPNYQIAARGGGFVIQKEFVDKYNLDVSSIKSFRDLEPFLEQIKANESDKIPYLSRVNTFINAMHGFDGIDGNNYRKGDPSYTLINTYATPEYMDHHVMLHDWYNKGYISKDAATTSFDEMVKTGKYVALYEFTLKPGGEAESKTQNGGHEVVYIPLNQPIFDGVQPTMTAISNTSKNPERAMMFLDLVNTDSTLFNLLAFGVEGKHYEKVDDKHIKVKPEGGYAPNVSWAMGNVTNGYLLEGQADDTWEKTHEINNSAIVPDLFGFQFNTEPVKTEMANWDAVWKEYEAALTTGSIDPAVYIPKMLDALNKAGSEKILQERQKQLDEWLKAKGKK